MLKSPRGELKQHKQRCELLDLAISRERADSAAQDVLHAFVASPGLTNATLRLTDHAGEAYAGDRPRTIVASDTGWLVTTASTVLHLSIAGRITEIAGSDREIGDADGAANDAQFNAPRGCVLSADQITFFVADSENHKIRQIEATGIVITTAGSGVQGSADGMRGEAQFDSPMGAALVLWQHIVCGR